MGTKATAVRVFKGSEHLDFTVHEDLIRKSSKLIVNKFVTETKESPGISLVLPDDLGSHDFQLYVQWLYTGRLHMSEDTERKTATEMDKLMQAYVLGTLLHDASYKDKILDATRDWIITAKEDERGAWSPGAIGQAGEEG
jgi:hypothetical protein